MDKISTPPGFVSQTTFVLRRVTRDKERSSSLPGLEQTTGFSTADANGFKTLRTNRPWILPEHTTPSLDALKPTESKVRARRPLRFSGNKVLDEAPVFEPTEEEFKDTLSYIASLREKAEPYGICCVVPPPSWKPPCLLKEKKVWEASSFVAQTQLFDGILTKKPEIKKEAGVDSDDTAFGKVKFCRRERGESRQTLESFKNFADSYKKGHFSMKREALRSMSSSSSANPEEPSIADVEKEYRQLVENPLVEIGVLYGNDIATATFGSGFPLPGQSESCNYTTSGWNLNNTAKVPGSLLPFGDCKSICVPRLSIGMFLSSQLWKQEKERLYMLSYMHLGAPRVWYSVAGCHRSKLRDTMESLRHETSGEQAKTSDGSEMMVSPYVLSTEGVPVTRCVQSPGQYVIIFPGSYYSAVDSGFNCLEKANFAPVDWLPHGDIAVQQNQVAGRKSSISFDRLWLSASRDAVKCLKEHCLSKKYTAWSDSCGKDKIFSNIVKSRIKQEKIRREFLSSSLKSQRMDQSYDAVSKRECFVCFGDLHLSAVQCSCSADRYTCLSHMRKLCACPCDGKSFLYRYTIDELNLLAEALEGKLSSMFRWGNIELNYNTSPAITRPEDKEEKKTGEVTPCSNVKRKDVGGETKEQTQGRGKERSMVDILNAEEGNDDETGSVRPRSTKQPGLYDSSAGNNTVKRHKQG